MAIPGRTYKQPRRFNAVSVTILLLLVGAGYVAFSAWPVVVLNADVNNVIEEALPKLYRANLLPEPESSVASTEVRQMLIEKLTGLGISNAEAALTVARDQRTVSLSVSLDAAVDLKLVGKKIPVHLNPRAETSAARVTY